MKTQHQEMSKLVDQVTADLAALQNEKDIVALKNKLDAAHSQMLQLQTHMKEQPPMMSRMGVMKGKMAKQTK